MSESVEDMFVGAPEEATHYNQNNQMFYKFIGDAGLFWNDSRSEWLIASSRHNYPAMIERPTVKPWSGPEDGLPPVGTVCELTKAVLLADEDSADWFSAGTKVAIGGHVMFNGATSSVCAICVVGDNFTGTLSASCLRPIQQPLEARETAIRELMDIAQVDCRVTAARLVDAGFKREACKSDCSTNNRGVPELLGDCDCR